MGGMPCPAQFSYRPRPLQASNARLRLWWDHDTARPRPLLSLRIHAPSPARLGRDRARRPACPCFMIIRSVRSASLVCNQLETERRSRRCYAFTSSRFLCTLFFVSSHWHEPVPLSPITLRSRQTQFRVGFTHQHPFSPYCTMDRKANAPFTASRWGSYSSRFSFLRFLAPRPPDKDIHILLNNVLGIH